MTRTVPAVLVLLAIAAPVSGHHSEAAEYDASKPVKVTGILKQVEWQNPHVWFYVDVKDENGNDHDVGIFRRTSRSADAPRRHEGGLEDRRRCQRRRCRAPGTVPITRRAATCDTPMARTS